MMLIVPPYAHISFPSFIRAGAPPISGPGLQSQTPVGDGTHGIGVRTPIAADVAEATVGFDRDVHIPRGQTFVTGAASCTVAAGVPPTTTVC